MVLYVGLKRDAVHNYRMTTTLADGLTALKSQKKVAVEELNTLALHRRANANLIAAGALTVFAGIFTTIPISIRQRDWKIWALPFIVAFGLGVTSIGFENKDSEKALTVTAWFAQAALATGFMAQNKSAAKFKLASAKEVN